MSGWRFQRRRGLRWLYPILGAVSGGLSVFLASVGWPPWIVVPLGIAGVAGLALTPFLKERAQVQDEQSMTRHRSMLTRGTELEAPLVKSISLRTWGVHQSLKPSQYLRRNAEDQFLAALAESKPVLVIGSSMAGKTRMAAQLVTENFPDKQALIPDAPDGVAKFMNAGGVPTEHVVWLDDLERYLQDPTQLKARWIQELQENNNIIVATMRTTLYETYMPTDDDRPRAGWDTLQCFTKVFLNDESQENLRLANLSDDTQTQQGILKYGLGTYLGGAFLTMERFEAGRATNLVGRAFVLAAIDWQRSGIADAIPLELAKNLVSAYVPPQRARITVEEMESGLSWATDRGAGGNLVELLSLSDEGLLIPFDYVADAVASTNVPIPSLVWLSVRSFDAPAGRLNHAGIIADSFGQSASASVLFERAARMGDSDGMLNYSMVLDRSDRPEDAMEWDRRAAEAGNLRGLTGQAVKMLRTGRNTSEAEDLLLRAAEAGESSAMANLGVLYMGRGEKATGSHWYRRSAEAGSALGMVNYGVHLELQGNESEAESWYLKALEAGDASGAAHFQMAMLAKKRGKTDDIEPLLRIAAGRKNPSALGSLGLLAAEDGRDQEASLLFRQAAARGGAIGLAMTGRDLAAQGKFDEAEVMFKRAISEKLTWATTDLGVLYANAGRTHEAKEQYLLSISAGDDHALQNYGELLRREGRLTEGEDVFRKAAALGSTTGLYLLSQALFATDQGVRVAEASQLLEKAAVLGNVDALYETGKLAAAEGNRDKALKRFKMASTKGHIDAADCVQKLESERT